MTVSGRLKKNWSNNSVKCYVLNVFHSMFNVERSMFDVNILVLWGLERSMLPETRYAFFGNFACRVRCDSVAPSVAKVLEGLISLRQEERPAFSSAGPPRRCIRLFYLFYLFYDEGDISPNRFVLRGNPGVCRSEYVPVPLSHGDVWLRHCHQRSRSRK